MSLRFARVSLLAWSCLPLLLACARSDAPGPSNAAPARPTPQLPGTGGTPAAPPPAEDAAPMPAPPSTPAPDVAAPAETAPPPPAPGPDAGTPPVGGGDQPPDRPLMVDTANPQVFSLKFKPSEADPGAARRDEVQTAIVDTGAKPHRGKLIVVLSGVGGGPGPLNVASFVSKLGFHAFAVAYENSVNPSGQNDPKFFGDMRFEQFDGTDRSKAITVARPDCVEVRVQKALVYLKEKNPAGDWGYFLDGKGEVRWSDVGFMGHSHGATSAAAYAKLRRVWRAISLAGPRDTNPVTAAWLSQPSATPIDRYFGFTAVGDAQHDDHIKSMEAMQYVGALTDVGGGTPPYGGSHRLKHAGGHGDSAACDRFAAPCKYMLGVE